LGLVLYHRKPLGAKPAQHSVHPTGGSLRVLKQFAWLEAGSGKEALSRPAHQRVTLTVRQLKKYGSDPK